MSSGIYQIKNMLNGKWYIGSAMNIQRRWLLHLAALRRGDHHNKHLQRAFDKYGEEVFVFEVLEEAEPEKLIIREQHYLDILKPEYNFSPTAGSPLGYRHTEAAKRKISKALMGHQISDDTRQKLSEAKTGERNPNYGKDQSGERGPFYGKHHSEETKRKISKALTGERSPMYGKHLSEETKQKISTGLKAYWRRIREAKEKLNDKTPPKD